MALFLLGFSQGFEEGKGMFQATSNSGKEACLNAPVGVVILHHDRLKPI
jgi:hypothetical protein